MQALQCFFLQLTLLDLGSSMDVSTRVLMLSSYKYGKVKLKEILVIHKTIVNIDCKYHYQIGSEQT